MSKSAKAVYKFSWDCGRQGTLEGVFVEKKSNMKKVVGQHVYFGEVLGKHSEIQGVVEDSDIVLVSDDPAVVQIFEDNDISIGYNPYEYFKDQNG